MQRARKIDVLGMDIRAAAWENTKNFAMTCVPPLKDAYHFCNGQGKMDVLGMNGLQQFYLIDIN